MEWLIKLIKGFKFFFRTKPGHITLFNNYRDVVSVNELCSMLRIGKNTAYELLKSGELKSIKIGKVYRIPKRYVIDYIENNTNLSLKPY